MSSPASPESHFVANNLALDFINTAYGVNEGKHDCLVDDMSVIQWLKAAGQLPADYGKAPAGLTPLARTLRQAAAQLIDAVSAGHSGDTAAVNQLLAAGQPVRRLEWDEEKASFVLVEQRRDDSAASLLEPVAASLADLLASDALRNVRQCEAHDCTLRFLDTTKSRRRRWCSMALCGNRMKVAAFRSRKQGE